jgi:TonB-dependent receptor
MAFPRFPAGWLTVVGLLVMFTLPLELFAQATGSITGRVVGDQGRTLSGAMVQLAPGNGGVLTDAEGRFTLRNVPAGTATLRISSVGFATTEVQVTVRAGETTTEEIVLEVNPLALRELVVEGQVGQAEAYNRQRTAASIRSVVSSDQIERFPDSQVPDVLRRIPGVSGQPDRGETGYVFIRGLSPDLTTVTVDGARLPSTSQTGRGVELSSIPAEMLESVEVIKAITPDMDADAMAGSINLTARQPRQAHFDGRIEGGSHSLARGSTYRGGLNYGDVAGPFSWTLGGDYAYQERQTENTQYRWTSFEDTENVLNRFMVQHYPIARTRYSVNGTVNYPLGDASRLFVRGFYSAYDTQEERHRLVYRLDSGNRQSLNDVTGARVERQGRQYIWERRIWDLTVGGDHDLANGMEIDYYGSLSSGSRRIPYRNYFEFRQSGVDLTADYADRLFPTVAATNGKDPNDLSDFGMRYYEQRLDDARDQDLGGGVNLTIPFAFGQDRAGSLRIGGKVSNRNKARDAWEATYDGIDGSFTMADMGTSFHARPITPRGYEFGPRLDWSAGERFWAANHSRFSDDPNETRENGDTEDYAANETVAAFFGMGTFDIGALQVIAGGRYEHTIIDYEGKRLVFDETGEYQTTEQTSADANYGSFFPALHLRYRLDPATNVRFAATRTIARPNFLRLAPNEYIRFDDQVIRRGNPELQPATSFNLDLLAERYFASVGTISGGLFYKAIRDFQFTARTDISGGEFAGFELRQPMNGESAGVYGFETAWHQRLGFLPGALNGLGIYANYTYTETETDFGDATARPLPLEDQFRHVGNVALTYDGFGFSGLVSLNHQSDYLESTGSSAANDRYGRYRNQIDASLSQRITPSMRLTLQLNNITNEPYIRYFPGQDGVPYENEFEGFWGTLGLRFSL